MDQHRVFLASHNHTCDKPNQIHAEPPLLYSLTSLHGESFNLGNLMRTLIYFIKLSFATILLTAASGASQALAQGVRWEGPELAETGWTYTNPGFAGWIWAGTDGSSDWAYIQKLNQFAHVPVDQARDPGCWMYIEDLGALNIAPAGVTTTGWHSGSGRFWYLPDQESAGESGWIYLVNLGPGLPLAPEEVVVEPSNVADHDAGTLEEMYADSIRLGPDYIAQFVDFDFPIQAEHTPDGIALYNPLNLPGGAGNRYIRIGFRDGGGYFDFTALQNVSGRIGMVVRADVDLTGTSNGFYVRAKRGETEVAAYERLGSGVLEEDIFLEPYLTNYEDNVYLEITLPWQGRITIKEIYLYMDSEARGFADMEARITGGAGATPENIHTVSDAAGLLAALDAVSNAGGAPSIINIDGAVTYDDWVAAGQNNREASISSDMANLSILGVGDQGLMDGVGFAVQGTNIIIQNMTVRYVLARDAIQVNNGTYVKIDHCTLYNEPFNINPDKDKFDELISIKNDAQHVIVSWNEIYDTHKTILVGSNDEVDALPDRRVIFHHNWFHDGGSRHPLYRGGYAHIYNNYYQNIDSGINTRTNSKILIENNYFEDMGGAIGYWFDTANPSGLWDVSGNIFDNVDGNKPNTSTIDVQFAGDYNYTLDAAADVPAIVTAGAGAGKL